MAGTPLFLLGLSLSLINQLVRRARRACGMRMLHLTGARAEGEEGEGRLLLTALVTRHLQPMVDWPWYEILSWAAAWAILFGWVGDAFSPLEDLSVAER